MNVFDDLGHRIRMHKVDHAAADRFVRGVARKCFESRADIDDAAVLVERINDLGEVLNKLPIAFLLPCDSILCAQQIAVALPQGEALPFEGVGNIDRQTGKDSRGAQLADARKAPEGVHGNGETH